jgi:uncharacterized protein YutE (UPF0331/DUF86 family)
MDKSILKNKIKLIAENLEKLKKTLPGSFADFQKNDLVLSASERYFQIIVDAIVDCNQILIEQNNLEVSDNYFNTFGILAKTEIFSNGLLENLSYCIGTRNALVHRYENIQLKREYSDIKKFLPLFLEYLKTLSNKYL